MAQVLILFVLETWFMNPCIGQVMGGFPNLVSQWMTVKKPQRVIYGLWRYPPVAKAMAESGLEQVETYIAHHQNTVAQYIVNLQTMDLCL